jgi:Secretion system C-terminal sorting domain
MKTKLLSLFVCFFTLICVGQSNGWYQYVKPEIIYSITPDDTDSNILHLATDIGYIQLNTFTDNVSDFLNLTSQNPPIGKVTSISTNPINNNIALGLTRSFAIYDGTNITIYDYTNSGLDVGQNSNQFTYLQVEYAKDGSLYIFIEDDFGYQKFNNGIVEPKVVTSFKPQAVAENNLGTEVFFGGSNNGLWKFVKGTTTWTNYTTSNSDLFSNFINALYMDTADNLFIGHFQGLDRLESNGTITNCNASSPVPVFDIDISPITGELLVRNSRPNSSSVNGFSVVDYDSCTWTNYTNDGSNCLNHNIYQSCAFGGNGEIYCDKGNSVDSGDIYRFNPITNSCSQPDINYLGATEMFRSSGFSEVNVRNSSDPFTFEIAITNANGVDIFDFPEENFDGNFPVPSNFNSFSGAPYDILSAGSYFVFTDSFGTFTFMDENGTTADYTLSIPEFSINKTKKANVDISSSTCTLVFSGWEGSSFDTKLYMMECDMANGSCSNPVELCSFDRDTTQPITFSCTEDVDSDNFRCTAVKENNTGEITLTEEVVSPENGTESIVFNHSIGELVDFISDDPIFLSCNEGENPEIYVKNQDGDLLAKVNRETGDALVYNTNGDVIVVNTANKPFANAGAIIECIAGILSIGSSNSEQSRKEFSVNAIQENSDRNPQIELPATVVPESLLSDLPPDIFIYSATAYPYSSSDFAVLLMTNYGLLIKSEIDYSFLSLGIDESTLIKSIALYPNPSNDFVSFTDSTISDIQIFNMRGKKVKESASSTISVKNLSNGLYIIKGVTNNGGQIVEKLIKN